MAATANETNGNQYSHLEPARIFEPTMVKNGEETCGSSINDEIEEETDLTSLTWLTELRNQNITFANTLSTPTEDDNKICAYKNKVSLIKNTNNNNNFKSKQTRPSKSGANLSKNFNQQIQTPIKRATPTERYKIFVEKIKRDLAEYEQSATSYQTDFSEKPPFNYSHIIGMAMLENGRVTLQQICTWIEEKFAFFRIRKKWNNSIRHNLSLHYCFRKIDRNKYEKGKGGYWELGVDPKKCDRKRIRNRKANRSKSDNVGIKSANSIRNRHSPIKQLLTASESAESIDMAMTLETPTFLRNSQDFPLECSINQQSVPTADVLSQSTPDATKCQQFHVGTIIINATEADISSTSLNLLGSSYDWPLYHHNFNSPDNVTTQSTENTVPTCMLDTTEIPDINSTSFKTYANTSQNQNIILKQFNIVPGSSSLRPNVIVEQVLQPNTSIYNDGTTENIMPLPTTCVTENTGACMSAVNVNDNFRPYIDGIEEAFQYLRSIDQNNREDILDNILDISVSDY